MPAPSADFVDLNAMFRNSLDNNPDLPQLLAGTRDAGMAEYVKSIAPYTEQFGSAGGEASVVYVIPTTGIATYLPMVLGYSYVQRTGGGTTGTLRRIPPLRHPRYDWMFANRIGIEYLEPMSRGRDGNMRHIPQDPVTGGIGNAYVLTNKWQAYRYARVTVTFVNMPIDLFTDQYIDTGANGIKLNGEWERYTILDSKPQLNTVSAQGGAYMLKFAEGVTPPAGGDPTNGPTAGTSPYPSSIQTYLYQTLYTLTWYWVPHDYLFSGNVPKQFLKVAGKVNNAAFAGFDKGTLLMFAPEFERVLWPIRTSLMSSFCWNVKIPMLHFDPKAGGLKGVAASSFNGHNLMPWRMNGYYYYATRNGSTSGEPFIKEADFTKVFKYVNAP